MPKVSVIVPIYNVEAYLRQCLDSLVNQTLSDIEIICVDDGSTDGSGAILQEYAAKDDRVKVLSHEHTNAGAARNVGMDVATGEYLGFVDSDDWCELTLFEKAYAKAKSDNADLVAWRYVQYDVRTQTKGAVRIFPQEMLSLSTPFAPEDMADNILAPITYAPWGRLVRRSFIASEHLRFQEIARSNDVYFCCMVLVLAKQQSLVDEVLYTYRVGTGANLQADNAASPDSVFFAWDLVVQDFEKRGIMGVFRKALITTSANSLTYTLNTMSTAQSHGAFFRRLRGLYLESPFYSAVDVEDILNPQTATYVKLLKENESQLDFLVKQANYYRERLAFEYWTRMGAQKANGEARQTINAARTRIGALEAQAKIASRRILELKADNERLGSDVVRLSKKVEDLGKKRDSIMLAKMELERSMSFRLGRLLTWLPRMIRDGTGLRRR